MKLLLCRHRSGGSTEEDFRVQARALGISRAGNETKGRNPCWSRRYAKEDLLQMGGSIAIGEEGEGSASTTQPNDLTAQLSDPLVERTTGEATQNALREPPVEGGKNFFGHFHCADTFARGSNRVEGHMEESRNLPFRSIRAHAVPPMCYHRRKRNKSSCFTEGEPLTSSAYLPTGGGKGPSISTKDRRQVGNPPASLMNRNRSRLGRRKKGRKKLTCMDRVLLRHSKCSECRFMKEVNGTYRCVRRSGAMCSVVAFAPFDECTIGKDNQQEDKGSPRREDDVAKERGILGGEHNKKRGILQGEDSKKGGSPKKVGLRVHWEDGKEWKEACFFEGGSSGPDRGHACHGSSNSDGASDCTQFLIDDGEKKAKEASTPGGSFPQRNSARSGEETLEECGTRFGRGGGPPYQSHLGGEATYSEVGAYMDVLRDTLDDSTMTDDITDLQPIHLATKEGNMDLVKKMIKSGIHIDTKTRTRKFTPLHLSASKGDLDAVKFLIEHNADINALSCDNETPLWCASMSNHLDVCRYLLTHGALPNLTIGRKTYDSPLHAASMMGNLEIVKLLTEYGADVSCLDSNQLEPVHYASFEGHKGIVKYLIWQQIRKALHTKMDEIVNAMHKYGVYSKALEQFYLLKCKSFYKKRIPSKILCCAIISGKEKIVDILLRRGADPNYFDVRLQLFPIHAASITGNLTIFKNLVRSGANLYLRTGCNNSVIDLTEDVEIKRYILQHSRKMNLRNAWLIRRRKSDQVVSRLSPDAFYYVCTFF
ncbi:hypothetical protein C922_03625 [Plasmodium inui San Antonio 1]|uniref:Uncharacterized protein n=1 Tax=Plasmodium inui San Antonio 1 TaxID=1237626 RepID=W7AKN1_9APIC|nr:hypothetical protein C922_03625 [Plasmodium inui San Antonio 1]EUD65901.1 hypothetical protein C922_03625 [Plasmodium inui San Antonio 1]